MRFETYIRDISSKRRKMNEDDNKDLDDNIAFTSEIINNDHIINNDNIKNDDDDDYDPKIGETRLALLMETDIECDNIKEKKFLWILDGSEKELNNYLHYIIPLKIRYKCIISKAAFFRFNEYCIGIPQN